MLSAAFRGISPATLLGLGALALAGCDAGKEPFANAAQAEEKGDHAAAATLYDEVCAKQSPLCDAAKKRKERLAIKRAWKALDEGHFKEAKAALDPATSSADAATANEAKALLALPELVQGVLFEDALAQTDKTAALAAMESVAREPSALAPKAKEWLDKNRPALLLAEVKAACAPGAKTSCVEASKRLAAAHPGSPEAKEAEGLVAADYKRLHPALKELEPLLIQRVGVFDKEKKIELCQAAGASEDECKAKYADVPGPTLDYLTGFWDKKLAGVDDPHYRQRFEKRWDRAGQGEYDQETWAKP